MQSYRAGLPNLDSLIAFEAAARHMSFKLAAEELGRTQSAISHRVKALEEQLGITLFERRHRSIQITGQGSELYSSVVLALNHLLAATDTISGDRAQNRLSLWTDIAFSNFWLAPRLPSFFARSSGVTLNHLTSDEASDGFGRAIDAAVVFGDGDWPGYHATRLFGERTFPVCAPSYLARHGPMRSAGDLMSANLIDLSYERSPWLNWTIWLAKKNLARGRIRRVFESNSYKAVIAAARSGVGVAMGWSYVLDDDLRAGTLVVPVAETVETDGAYYLICPNNMADTPPINLLRDWLCCEVKAQKTGFPPLASFVPAAP